MHIDARLPHIKLVCRQSAGTFFSAAALPPAPAWSLTYVHSAALGSTARKLETGMRAGGAGAMTVFIDK